MGNPFGLFLIVVGLPGAIWPYRVARFEERIDAIGSKRRWSEIEPAAWRVTFSRILGIVLIVIGLWLLAFG